jgi:hypothetical protein
MQVPQHRTTSQTIKPEKTAEGKVLVDWFTTGSFHSSYLTGKL